MSTSSGRKAVLHRIEGKEEDMYVVIIVQAITRSRAANSKKEVETKANQRPTTTTSECFNVFHQKYF